MDWNSDIIKNLSWAGTITNRAGKQKLADKIAEKVKDGDVIGIGSGSTAYLALFAIAAKIKAEELNIKAIPTSIEIALACTSLGIPLTTLYENRPDWLFDGADEVDPNHCLIKGRGGALFKEKLLISSSKVNYIIIDDTKLVDKLGAKFPVPIEVFPAALPHVEEKLKELGANSLVLRLATGKDGPVITENGNLLLDVRFAEISNDLEFKIKAITGVIESGLFINYDVEVLVASNSS
ncbi:ribose 5-phosphate isomerase A [Mucilaginibacter sp.]|uniref:ribose 5-phosphate isomerase A n=1 Tax=Mucilaginibacter sp. TaxID=1882438 RepID=UPI0026016AB7|nr:ribose 5-phosphate isomerase A [Mucilaginibacter sp.]MDB4925850.1 ribose-5-phosphate isomerase [Mucilaginibacter sp.]